VSGIHAARVAASLKRDLPVDVETVEGRYGEFTVLIDGEEVVRAGPLGFVGVLPGIRTVRSHVARKMRGD
jgi:hypothetical protein